MWYKFAQTKFNIYGLPISNSKSKIKQFSGNEDVESDTELDEIQDEEIIDNDEDSITIDDPTPETEFTPEDLQIRVEQIENDPTSMMQLPPLHDNCRCVIETIPVLSTLNSNDGRRIWKKAKECCPVCEKSAIEFNNAELLRLENINKS